MTWNVDFIGDVAMLLTMLFPYLLRTAYCTTPASRVIYLNVLEINTEIKPFFLYCSNCYINILCSMSVSLYNISTIVLPCTLPPHVSWGRENLISKVWSEEFQKQHHLALPVSTGHGVVWPSHNADVVRPQTPHSGLYQVNWNREIIFIC